MASLTKKLIHGRPYYYLRECQRINGKPKVVWQQYLGSAEDLARRLSPDASTELAPHKATVREFGASAACLAIAQQLDLVGIIDRHVPKQGEQGPSVGQYHHCVRSARLRAAELFGASTGDDTPGTGAAT